MSCRSTGFPPNCSGGRRDSNGQLIDRAEATLAPENYAFLERYIQQETGIALGPDKQYLLESRLAPVLQDERLGSLNELCGRLRKGCAGSLRRRIAECMTTHETSFFRDPALFEALRSDCCRRSPAAPGDKDAAHLVRGLLLRTGAVQPGDAAV